MKANLITVHQTESLLGRRTLITSLGVLPAYLLSPRAIAKTAASDRTTWQPDGAGWRARIGLLAPDDDTVPESEFWTMAPDGVSVHASRVPLGEVGAYSDPPGPDNATELLARLPLNSIVFAFTTSSYLLGTAGEQALAARLERRSNGVPIVFPCAAAVAAFRALEVHRIALVHPHWFSDGDVAKGAAYFHSQGFEVVHASHMTPARAVPPHPNTGADISPGEIYQWVRRHAPANTEGVFIAGNGIRAIGVIGPLEEDLGRAVLTGNQAAFWYALRQAGVGAAVDGYGQVFRKNPGRA